MTGITGSVVTKQLWTPTRHNHPIPSPKKATTSSPGSKGAAPSEDRMLHLELEWLSPEDGHIKRIPALPTSRQSFPQAELPMARLQRRDSTKLGRRRHTTDVAESTPTAHTNQTAPKGGAFKKEYDAESAAAAHRG